MSLCVIPLLCVRYTYRLYEHGACMHHRNDIVIKGKRNYLRLNSCGLESCKEKRKIAQIIS
jgi:hypothetical protein